MRRTRHIRRFYLMHKQMYKCVSVLKTFRYSFRYRSMSGVFPEMTEQSACCCFGLERSDKKQQYPLQTSLCIFNLIREALCFNGEKQ